MKKTTKVIAVCNQKGGVGKTVTTVNLGVGLAQQGKRVLLVDVDPQGSLTASLGYHQPDRIEKTLSTVLGEAVQQKPFDPAGYILHQDEGVDLLPVLGHPHRQRLNSGGRSDYPHAGPLSVH